MEEKMEFNLQDLIETIVGIIIGVGVSIPITISKCSKNKVNVKHSYGANVAGGDLKIEKWSKRRKCS